MTDVHLAPMTADECLDRALAWEQHAARDEHHAVVIVLATSLWLGRAVTAEANPSDPSIPLIFRLGGACPPPPSG